MSKILGNLLVLVAMVFFTASAKANDEAPMCAQVVPDCDAQGNPQGPLGDPNSACFCFYKIQCLQALLRQAQEKLQLCVSAGQSLAKDTVECTDRCKAAKNKKKGKSK